MRSLLTLSARQADAAELRSIARFRTESANRVKCARILLHYRDDPSCYAVGRDVGVTHQTVQRCLARATRFGVMGRSTIVRGQARSRRLRWKREHGS